MVSGVKDEILKSCAGRALENLGVPTTYRRARTYLASLVRVDWAH